MSSQPVQQALDMGFDYDVVRIVVHLNMVQSGTDTRPSVCLSQRDITGFRGLKKGKGRP